MRSGSYPYIGIIWRGGGGESQTSTLDILSLSTLFFGTGSFTGVWGSPVRLTWLVSEFQQNACLCLSALRFPVSATKSSFLCWGLEIELKSSCFQDAHFIIESSSWPPVSICSWCTFNGFWQMYNDIHSPLSYLQNKFIIIKWKGREKENFK